MRTVRALSIMFTRDDDVLDVFAGAVCDVDVHFDGLTMVVNLKKGCKVRESKRQPTHYLLILLTADRVMFPVYKLQTSR